MSHPVLRERTVEDLRPEILRYNVAARSRINALLEMANLAGQTYNGSSIHKYDLTDCLLLKMNLLRSKRQVRRNPHHPVNRTALNMETKRALERVRDRLNNPPIAVTIPTHA